MMVNHMDPRYSAEPLALCAYHLAERVACRSDFCHILELGVQGMNLSFVGGRLRNVLLLLLGLDVIWLSC